MHTTQTHYEVARPCRHNIPSDEEEQHHHHHTTKQATSRMICSSHSFEASSLPYPQDADDTIVLDDEVDCTKDDSLNNSTYSVAAPVRNLMNTFGDMDHTFEIDESGHIPETDSKKELFGSPDDSSKDKKIGKSPSGVDSFPNSDSEDNGTDQEEKKCRDSVDSPACDEVFYSPGQTSMDTIEFPEFKLSELLQLSLPQPVINRCSMYSVIHGVNKEIRDMASEDHLVEEVQDETSALIKAVNSPAPKDSVSSGSLGELVDLDEEEFLLAAIRSRTPEEMAVRSCPASFAEAIGEADNSQGSDQGTVSSNLSSARTQLWKPSRSWWEAKSGKNPWIEPKSHNKRWRYLWPLIHYHKFLAKCIKKLKRNGIDVKTGLSPVCAFLREEVCAISGHLAVSSRFTSEEWMEGLPHFHGWTNQDDETNQKLQDIISRIPMRISGEPNDEESPLLRNQIDQCFLKAMAVAREQMSEPSTAQEQDDSSPLKRQILEDQRGVNASGSGPNMQYKQKGIPRNPNGARHNLPPKSKKNRNVRKPVPSAHLQQGRGSEAWSRDGQYSNHNSEMYAPQPYPYSGQGYQHPYSSDNMYNPGWPPSYPPNMYNGNGSQGHEWGHPMNYHNQWDQSMNNGMQYFQPPNGQMPAYPNHEVNQNRQQEHYPDVPIHGQMGVPPQGIDDCATDQQSEVSTIPDEGMNLDPVQTPLKGRFNPANSVPASPHWAHLGVSTLAMSGLATPQGAQQSSPQIQVDDMQTPSKGSKHLTNSKRQGQTRAGQPIIYPPYNYRQQGSTANVPPSPATQFMMSPQGNPLNAAYYSQTHMQSHYHPQSPMPHQNVTLVRHENNDAANRDQSPPSKMQPVRKNSLEDNEDSTCATTCASTENGTTK